MSRNKNSTEKLLPFEMFSVSTQRFRSREQLPVFVCLPSIWSTIVAFSMVAHTNRTGKVRHQISWIDWWPCHHRNKKPKTTWTNKVSEKEYLPFRLGVYLNPTWKIQMGKRKIWNSNSLYRANKKDLYTNVSNSTDCVSNTKREVQTAEYVYR